MSGEIEGADWPLFGWVDDIRAPLAEARRRGRPAALATLYKVEGSAPRGPGAQMLFVEPGGPEEAIAASGYFSGDCIEGDVASHAAHVLADGMPRHLHYGAGSPWIDIRLRCGGALHVLVERLAPDSAAAGDVLHHAEARSACRWHSDGKTQQVTPDRGPLLDLHEAPFSLARRYDPPRRLIVSGGDPGALAAAQLAALSQFETILLRPDGPHEPPPFAVSRYLRTEPAAALAELGVDRWTAYLGATHEDHHDLGGCLAALRGGAGYVGMIGARSRAGARLAALEAAGATPGELARLNLSPGVAGLGKSPWEVATGIVAEIMQALNPAHERA
ncbi:xanthine dehydrogenase accessory factor [Novosphingobium sp. PhB57]|jgi:xanthine dehydrogenase accessory factor|uniref:XdhC family protein n=1 Tax=unclassified Novosphingobium TaxID=2644732 RepID=UPI00104BDE2E|nr:MULTISPECIES: XdhC family protein [unclassified Novosphingobium]TCU59891.1 xanthine dehydrogenase accessory factor [Novosphingobium sp. PhB57]TDW62692.1 xanthine dehydrogenase accessory factor [Novosphingobium sp. PhB55]